MVNQGLLGGGDGRSGALRRRDGRSGALRRWGW